MTKKTTNIFFASLAAATVSLVAAGYFFYVIEEKSQKLDEQIKIITENNAKESTFIRLKRLAQETEGKREKLSEHFFGSEEDSIAFLNEVETFAKQLGLSLKTEALDKVVGKDNSESIKVIFSYEGEKDKVVEFSKLMELIPYHSKIESLKIDRVSGNNWKGSITIMVTIDTL